MDEQPAGGGQVTEAERERATAALREHLTAGQLTLDELVQRLDWIAAAKTQADLAEAYGGLPAPAPAGRRAGRWIVAVLGGADRRGRWRVAERTIAVAFLGGCHLDLRGAEIASPEISLTCLALVGGIDVTVPDGVEVELSGFALVGSNDSDPGDAPRRPGAPHIRVRAFAFFGSVEVRAAEVERADRRGPRR